jgi:hypothetical protein
MFRPVRSAGRGPAPRSQASHPRGVGDLDGGVRPLALPAGPLAATPKGVRKSPGQQGINQNQSGPLSSAQADHSGRRKDSTLPALAPGIHRAACQPARPWRLWRRADLGGDSCAESLRVMRGSPLRFLPLAVLRIPSLLPLFSRWTPQRGVMSDEP